MAEPHESYRLPHVRAPGSWQMAADRSLLTWCSRGSSRLLFRTYDWEHATLSLGRVEPFPMGWNERALRDAGVAVVRRPTGGDAVLHDEELTFAVAASIPGPWGLSPRGFTGRVGEAVVDALRACGVRATRAESEAGRRSPPRPGATLCFARAAPGEVCAEGFKIAGLASRFARGAALCHGSVPLTPRHRDVARFRERGAVESVELLRWSRSLGELLGREIDSGPVADRLAAAVAARFFARLQSADFSLLHLAAEVPVR